MADQILGLLQLIYISFWKVLVAENTGFAEVYFIFLSNIFSI